MKGFKVSKSKHLDVDERTHRIFKGLAAQAGMSIKLYMAQLAKSLEEKETL